MPAPVREPDRPPDDDQARIEEERSRREAEELESFERRADWWSLHYGGRGDEAGERTREALEHAERLPSDDEGAERDEP